MDFLVFVKFDAQNLGAVHLSERRDKGVAAPVKPLINLAASGRIIAGIPVGWDLACILQRFAFSKLSISRKM